MKQASRRLTLTRYCGRHSEIRVQWPAHPAKTLTGGIPGTREERTLSWTERHTNDSLFGYVVGKSRWVPFCLLRTAFLTFFKALPGLGTRRRILEAELDC
jgi:hypothetical protein